MATPRGTPALLAMTTLGFSGYALLLPVSPLWATHGGAGTAGAGAVNGVLMLFTVLMQPVVPGLIRRWGWGAVMAAGVTLLGLPSLAHLLSDDLLTILALSAVRGLGFGILTVTGSAAVAELFPPGRRGRAIGAYGLAIAAPQLVLLPLAPWVAERYGFGILFVVGTLPLLAIGPSLVVGRILDGVVAARDHYEAKGAPERSAYIALAAPVALLLAVTLAGGALLTFIPLASSSSALTTVSLLVLTATATLPVAVRSVGRPARGPAISGPARRHDQPRHDCHRVVGDGTERDRRGLVARRDGDGRHLLRRPAEPHPGRRLPGRFAAGLRSGQRSVEHGLRRGYRHWGRAGRHDRRGILVQHGLPRRRRTLAADASGGVASRCGSEVIPRPSERPPHSRPLKLHPPQAV